MTILPRGIRLNNPGNIDRNAIHWQGMSTMQDDPRFIRFDHPQDGIRALMKLMITYEHKYGLSTVKGLIHKYAPPHENATDSYVKAVSNHLGVNSDMVIDVERYLIKLAQGIVRHENGKAFPGYPEYWYEDSVYADAEKSAVT